MQDSSSYEYTSMKNLGETKQGIWGVLARKAKSIIDDNNTDQPHVSEVRTRMQHMPDSATIGEVSNFCWNWKFYDSVLQNVVFVYVVIVYEIAFGITDSKTCTFISYIAAIWQKTIAWKP